jgi:hypothetical protein
MAHPQSIQRALDLRSARFDLLYAALLFVQQREDRQNTDRALEQLTAAAGRYRTVADALKSTEPDQLVVDALSDPTQRILDR